MTAAPPQSDATDQLVEDAAQPPCPRHAVVPDVAADPGARPVHVVGEGIGRYDPLILEHGATTPLGVAGHRVCGTRLGVGPTGLGSRRRGWRGRCGPPAGTASVSKGNTSAASRSPTTTSWRRLSTRGRATLGGKRRHQTHPERGETGAQHRDRDDHPAPQSGLFGVDLHHVLIGQDVGSADLQRPGSTGASSSMARTSRSRTSLTAMGWQRVRTQRGVVITGRTSVR